MNGLYGTPAKEYLTKRSDFQCIMSIFAKTLGHMRQTLQLLEIIT